MNESVKLKFFTAIYRALSSKLTHTLISYFLSILNYTIIFYDLNITHNFHLNILSCVTCTRTKHNNVFDGDDQQVQKI